MDDEKVTPLAELALPWGKQLIVSELAYESGLKMLRLRFREGKHRFTIVEIAPDNITQLGELFSQWTAAQIVPAEGEDDGA